MSKETLRFPEVIDSKGIGWTFPGQGSQGVGMGKDIYQRSLAARNVFESADEMLGFKLSGLMFEGPDDELRKTINAQPAILVHSVAVMRALEEQAGERKTLLPKLVAGHSLGEYTALVGADVLDLQDALPLVRERGRLMQEAGYRTPGGMVALMGLGQGSAEEICQLAGAEIANINCSGQIIVSGSRLALARAIDMARSQGAKRVTPLGVSGPFHSKYMEPAREELEKAISRVVFRDPKIPIIANTTAQPITSAEQAKQELLSQLCGTVLWQKSVEYMIRAGVSIFVEMGPGQVLTGLARRIVGDKAARAISLGTMPDIKNFTSVVGPSNS